MKNPDEAVERVLAGLREAEAPEGMERRILEAMGEAAGAAVQGAQVEELASRRRRAASWRVAGTVSWAAGVAVVAGALCWSSLWSSRTGDHAGDQSVVPIVTSTSIPEPQRGSAKVFRGAPITPVRRSQGSVRPARIVRVRARDATDRRKALPSSYPAPPMPLTEQERLLLRVAHKADPTEIAMLDPAVRAARDAEEAAEVEKFFEPATTEGDHE